MMETTSAPRSSLIRHIRATVLVLLVTVAVSTSQPVLASSQTTVYGPFPDGCFYVWDGVQYIEAMCPQQDGSIDFYVPSGNGWEYAMKVIPWGANTGSFRFADGTRVDLLSDGSLTIFAPDGRYGIFASDGTVIETGYVDSRGLMVQTSGRSRGTLNPWTLTTLGVPMDPYTFDMINNIQDSRDQGICITLGNSSTDYDYDYNTGFNELVEHCSQ